MGAPKEWKKWQWLSSNYQEIENQILHASKFEVNNFAGNVELEINH